MGQPILFVVTEDDQVLQALTSDLRRRYSADYQIVAAPSAAAALPALEQLAAHSEQVALLIAAQRLGQHSGVDFLTQAHRLHPAARRVLLLDRGDYTAANPAVQAMTLGQIDYHLFTPWLPERSLYPVVGEFLANWAKTQQPPFEPIRIVGHEWAPRSHELRELLTRIGLPYGFYPADSQTGRQLLQQTGQDGSRLPVVMVRTGQVLVDPPHAELVQALGATTQPQSDRFDLAIVGAGPAGLAAAVAAASEGLHTLVLELQVPGGQAATSSRIRNYPGFPPRDLRRRPRPAHL